MQAHLDGHDARGVPGEHLGLGRIRCVGRDRGQRLRVPPQVEHVLHDVEGEGVG
jgi:hypothetical protein